MLKVFQNLYQSIFMHNISLYQYDILNLDDLESISNRVKFYVKDKSMSLTIELLRILCKLKGFYVSSDYFDFDDSGVVGFNTLLKTPKELEGQLKCDTFE